MYSRDSAGSELGHLSRGGINRGGVGGQRWRYRWQVGENRLEDRLEVFRYKGGRRGRGGGCRARGKLRGVRKSEKLGRQ